MSPRLVTGIILRNDFMGYNAKRKFRDITRAMCHNLYKILCDAPDKARLYIATWRKLKGRALFMNMVRSFSNSDLGSTADPRLSTKLYTYLCNLYQNIKAEAVSEQKAAKQSTKGKRRSETKSRRTRTTKTAAAKRTANKD